MMARKRKNRNLANIIEDYMLSSRIDDYYGLPAESPGKIIEQEGDYFSVHLTASRAFWKDERIAKGLQRRIVNALRNSFSEKRFSAYDIKDTAVSVNMLSEEYSSRLYNLKALDRFLDNTGCDNVRLFSGTMQNGYARLAARMDEKGAVVYVHNSLMYLAAFEMLGVFIKEESDREWLLDYVQNIMDEKPKPHF